LIFIIPSVDLRGFANNLLPRRLALHQRFGDNEVSDGLAPRAVGGAHVPPRPAGPSEDLSAQGAGEPALGRVGLHVLAEGVAPHEAPEAEVAAEGRGAGVEAQVVPEVTAAPEHRGALAARVGGPTGRVGALLVHIQGAPIGELARTEVTLVLDVLVLLDVFLEVVRLLEVGAAVLAGVRRGVVRLQVLLQVVQRDEHRRTMGTT